MSEGTKDIMWMSKLGNQFPKHEIERHHDENIQELVKLRRLKGNSVCADCGHDGGTVWSSVNLGVFLCMKCGSLHRALGTHISKPKGCTGTYLWGPDEMARMREVGNIRANLVYGGESERPSRNASDAEWLDYLRRKYEARMYAPKPIHATLEGKQKATPGAGKTLLIGKLKYEKYDAPQPKSQTSEIRKKASPSSNVVPTGNLLGLDDEFAAEPEEAKDFFAQYGV